MKIDSNSFDTLPKVFQSSEKQEKPAQASSIAADIFSDQVTISPEGISKALGKGFLAVTELDSAEKPQSLTPDNSNRLNMVLSDMGYPPNTPSMGSGGTGGAPDVPPIKDKPGGVG